MVSRRGYWVRILLVIVLASWPLAGLSAQTVIKPGDRVRLISRHFMYQATIVDFLVDTMVVRPDQYGESVRVAYNSLIRVDVYAGRDRFFGAGAGALLGAALGGVGGLLVKVLAEPETDMSTLGWIGAGGGGTIGAIIGFVTAGELWRDSGFPRRPLVPAIRRARLGVRLPVPGL